MTPREIVAKFSNTLEQFEPIDRQPSDTDFTRIQEFVAPLLLQIPYDETRGTHNLIGLIRTVASCTTRYGAAFVKSTGVRYYDATIGDDATAVVHAHMEATHKAKRANRGNYKTARRDTAQFILTVVEDTCVR